MKKLLWILPVGMLLAGCQEEEVHSVAYYVEHHDERAQMVEACESEGQGGENCRNARAAILKASSESDEMPSF